MDKRPEKPAVEPEILPPARGGGRPRQAAPGVHVVFADRRYEWRTTATTGSLPAILLLVVLAIVGGVVLVLLAGTVAIWVIVLLALFAVVTAAATLGRFWRRLRGG
jgi:hypothetical protein